MHKTEHNHVELNALLYGHRHQANSRTRGSRCPKRWVAQVGIRLATAVINLETRQEMLGHPVKVKVLHVLKM